MADEKDTKSPAKAEKAEPRADTQEEPKTTYIVNDVEVDPNGKPV